MTREEEIVRSTVAALASTVTQVRPLQLTEAAGESTESTPAVLDSDGGTRPRAARRWRTWGAPAAAAALVIALAVALVVVRNMPNGGRVTPVVPANCALPSVSGVTPAGAAPSARDVPRYYVEVVPCGGKSTSQAGLLVGDTFTGKVVATVAPPAGTSFLSVSAAADDRTFAVFVTPAGAAPQVAGWWYLLRLAPGTSSPARLTRIPVKPLSDVAETALSASGRELAVGVASGEAATPWLGVYSVATGRLLRSWSSHGAPPFRIQGWGVSLAPGIGGNLQSSSLTWVQGDQVILFWAVANGAGDLRRLEVAGGGSDIVRDSQVIWSDAHRGCMGFSRVSADGKTVICPVATTPASGAANWTVRWLAYPVTATAAPRVRYQIQIHGTTGLSVSTPWVSASGATMIVEWAVNQPPHGTLTIAGFGLVSHGTFTPLKLPPLNGGFVGGPPSIAW